MIVLIDKSLEKDVRKIKDESVKKVLAEIIQEIQNAGRLTDIIHLKKLQGTKNCFRIRIGDYRLGLIVNGQKVELIRLLHRKEIYRYFP
jgi:mRNA interferase RelE/StbE